MGIKKYKLEPVDLNLDKKLGTNTKSKLLDSTNVGTVTPANPYSDLNESAGSLNNAIKAQGDAATDVSASLADTQNATIMKHNRDVDSKVMAESFEEARLRAQQNLANSNYSLTTTATGGIGDLSKTGLGADQQANANTIIAEGRQRGLSDGDITIALMTSLAESGLKNVNYGDRDSLGLFQQRPSQGWGSAKQVTNPVYATNKFYDALGRTKRGSTPWQTAQNVQRSASSDGGIYKAQYGIAQKIMAAANNPVAASIKSNAPLSKWMNNQVGKYHDYDNAYGTQCVDLFRYYIQFKGQPQPGSVGGAKNIWESPAIRSQMARYNTPISRNSRAQMGDIAVFGGSLGSGYGHVGIVIADNGNTIKLLNSNSSTVGNGKATNIVTISKSGLDGYWRPKR